MKAALIILLASAMSASGQVQFSFANFAGTPGTRGYADGNAREAQFGFLEGIAVDSAGNVYVADYWYHTIRKITPDGEVTTLAGSPSFINEFGRGEGGYADGTGSAALFSNPYGVAVDSAGSVYVADYRNYTIRKITPAGDVTTLAGTAGQSGSDDGIGSEARFGSQFGSGPSGVAVDSADNVYAADTFNHTIRKITPDGVVTTLAGSPGQSGSADGTGSAARFNQPFGVAVDSAGNVYVADQTNHTIRKITPTGVVTTLAGKAGQIGSADGTGSAARFKHPRGVAVDSVSNVYVADYRNYTIRKITPAGAVTTLAGSAGQIGSADGTGSAARFNYPFGVAVDSAGSLYVTDTGNNRITKGTLPGGTLPALKVIRSGDTLLITWPASVSGAVLETTDSLPPTSWLPVAVTPVTIGDQTAVTVDIEGAMKFYRLKRP
ncbi:MAG: hypothetical protein HYY24_22385 [Verrucomicrobia bacterium]|nr:hypothetical protein [Verrucomicrobiota bacterium]